MSEEKEVMTDLVSTTANFDLDHFRIGLAQQNDSDVPDIVVGFINEDETLWKDYVILTRSAVEAVRDFLGWGMIQTGETVRDLCWERKPSDDTKGKRVILSLNIEDIEEQEDGSQGTKAVYS